MGNYDPSTKTFTEMPGVFVRPETVVPEGLDHIDLRECLMGICSISGDNPNLEKNAHNKCVNAMGGERV